MDTRISSSGYKKTELGLLPHDWEVHSFSKVTNLITCGIAATPAYVPESIGCPFLSSSNVKNGRILWDNFKYISPELHKKLYRNNPPLKGDVLYSRVGTIGEAAVIEAEFEFSIYVSLTLIKPRRSFLDSYYLSQLLNSGPYKVRAQEQVYLGGGVGNLNVDVVRHYPIPCPPRVEQLAIANALTDTDTLIECLEKLIAKKQAIKTATMQQLLTGKTRLPQFAKHPDGTPKGTKQSELGEIPEDWGTRSIGDFTDCTAGGTPSTSNSTFWGGDNPWMSSGELHLKRVYDVAERITNEGLKSSSTKYIPQNCVLVGLAGQGRTRGTAAVNCIKLCTNQSIAAIFPSAEHVTEFLFYNLDMRYEELRSLSTGDGGRGGLNLTIIRGLKVAMPPLGEQESIAGILTDLDREIDKLKEGMKKIRQIKQGMMQQLLTGKIRLVQPEAVTV
ncbi:restriction endonuclease subunit S [Microbulbifer sp. ZKSA004]|uniref:restriction endonuclease subunit S n=1 Tax=Microbulbifer sp. ZKSA004 TaxID=3243389 RepID=UPI004039F8EC